MIGTQNVTFDKANNPSVEPTVIKDGLAIYCIGQGDPILLMPYPHGFTTASMAEGALTSLLVSLDRKVITFDPPGAYRSTRPAQVDLPEMLACAEETLNTCQISGSVDVIGHSMGSLCALAFAIERPRLVQRLVLIGSMSGFPAIRRWGMPNNWRWWRDPEYWRFAWWGFLLLKGWGNLEVHKKLKKLIDYVSFVDKTLVPQVYIEKDDKYRPAPLRDRWLKNVRQVDYSGRLGQVCSPTLICVGRFDPQTPVACSEELVQGISKARLIIFEKSGHSPFMEEPKRFTNEVASFLK